MAGVSPFPWPVPASPLSLPLLFRSVLPSSLFLFSVPNLLPGHFTLPQGHFSGLKVLVCGPGSAGDQGSACLQKYTGLIAFFSPPGCLLGALMLS